MVLLSGLSLIIVCSSLFIYAFYQARNANWKLAVLSLILAGLILRVYISLDPNLHKWDERYHALVAKNMVGSFLMPTLYKEPLLPYDPKNWSANHIWLHKQPLPLWLMSLSIFLFGNLAFAVRIPSIILSTIGILLIYQIGKKTFDQRTGFLAAFLYSINGLILELTGGRVATDHIDVAFMFFVMLSVFLVCNNPKNSILKYFFVGLSIGAAMLCKWLPALVVLPVWFVLRTNNRSIKDEFASFVKETLVMISGILLIFLPWQIYMYLHFPEEMKLELQFNLMHYSQTLENHSGNVFYFINKIRINYGELIYLPLIWAIYQLIKKYNAQILAMLIWFTLPLLFFSFAMTKMQGYIVFASAPLFLFTANFYYWLLEFKNRKIKLFCILLCILLIGLPIRYSLERIKPFIEREDAEFITPIKNFHADHGVLFNYPMPIEAMYFTNIVAAYSKMPSKEEIDILKKNGFTIYVNSNNAVEFPGKDLVNLVNLEKIK
jgi:4-amino-4-deoxy-L-arabinose transferase